MLYEILTRRLPFDAEETEEVFRRVLHEDPSPPSQASAGAYIPARLDSIVLRSLARDREERYQTVGELKDSIEKFLRGTEDLPARTFEAGDVIVRSGDEGQHAYVIASGLCSVWSETPNGEVLLNYMRAGDVFGEAAVFSKGRRSATVKAEEKTIVYVVSEELIDAEMEGQKPWTASFIRTLAERFRSNSLRLNRLIQPPDSRRLHRHVFMFVSAFGTRLDDRFEAPWSEVAHECMVRFDVEETFLVATLAGVAGVEVDVSGNRVIVASKPDIIAGLRRPRVST